MCKIEAKKLKKIFNNFFLHSTAQCLPRIVQTENSLAQLTWSLIFVICSCLTSYLILRELIGFFEYQVVSTIKIVNQIPAPFPVVQVCNGNFLTQEMIPLVERIMKETFNDQSTNSSIYFECLEKATDLIQMQLIEMKNRSYYTKAPPLVKCQFDKTPCDLTNDVKLIYTYKYGECMRFNDVVDEAYLKKSRVEHEDNGLKLWIGPLTSGTSVKLFVTNQSYTALSPDGIYVRGGDEVFVKLTRQFTYNTPYPYSSCVDLNSFDSKFYTKTIQSYEKYSQVYCFRFCIQQLIIDTCKCFHPRFKKLDDLTPVCQNLADLECADRTEKLFVGENIEKCQLKCPLECETKKFELQMSGYDLSLRQFDTHFKRNNSFAFDEVKKSFLIINVFYPHLEYTEISLEPKTSVIGLISNLGGALGIFLGLSIFNFVELIECVLLILRVLILK